MLSHPSFSEISVGSLSIHVWGLFAALGFILALKMTLGRAYGAGISKYLVWDLLIIALAAMIAGGRVFYFLSSPDKGISMLTGLGGGFSLAGGVVAAMIFCLVYLRIKKQDFLKIFDCLTPGAIAALILVRIGCFLINDHVGAVTALPWGLLYEDGTMRHPVALYEIVFLALMFFIVKWEERGTKPDGALFIVFSLSYAVFRVFVDFLRCDDLSVCDARFASLTASQWFFSASVFVLIFLSLKERPSSRTEAILKR